MHKPVLINEVLSYLDPKDGEVFIDATFGAGGYTRQILEKANCHVKAFDRDVSAIETSKSFKSLYSNRFEFFHDKFSQMPIYISEPVDGIVFDIGVSSMQIDQGERGFSFLHNGPLDMRMNQNDHVSAKDIVNNASEKDLADIIYNFGDERKSRIIAKKIVEARTEKAIETTQELANIVRKTIGRGGDKIDSFIRIFQAIRIAVNEELKEIQTALENSVKLLKKGGRLVVVTFHSGEDKIVKKFFNKVCGKVEGANRHMPYAPTESVQALFKTLHKGTIIAGKEELDSNIRARSAKLRSLVRL